MFYFGWMAIGFMAIAGLATAIHWYNRGWYESNLLNIRKTSYAIMALIYFGMILAGHILLNDWVQAVQFASIAIFIDLAILETPSIQKIGNTEFKKMIKLSKTQYGIMNGSFSLVFKKQLSLLQFFNTHNII